MSMHETGRTPSRPRSVVLVVLLSIVTCGFYLVYWYFTVLGELEQAAGYQPTGHAAIIDFLLTLVTCGIWGLYVDYRISSTLFALAMARNVPNPSNTVVPVLVLDVVGLGFIGSAIHQSEMNRLWNHGAW